MEQILNFNQNKNKKTFNDLGDGRSLKEIADDLMKLKGNIKGEGILNNLTYIEKEKGINGLKKIEDKMKEIGHPLVFKNIKSVDWYPESYNALINVVARSVFNWNDNDIFNSGMSAPRYSLFTKIMMRYLISPFLLMSKANEYWGKMFDFGKINVVESDEKNRKIIFRVEGYNKSSVSCIYQAGYYFELFRYVLGRDKNIKIQETKCIHANDDYHEYKITWN